MTHLRIDVDFGADATVESVQLLAATLTVDFSVPVAGPQGPVGTSDWNTLTNKPEIATQEDAEAATNNEKLMTPLRTAQAAAARVHTSLKILSSGGNGTVWLLTVDNNGIVTTAAQ